MKTVGKKRKLFSEIYIIQSGKNSRYFSEVFVETDEKKNLNCSEILLKTVGSHGKKKRRWATKKS